MPFIGSAVKLAVTLGSALSDLAGLASRHYMPADAEIGMWPHPRRPSGTATRTPRPSTDMLRHYLAAWFPIMLHGGFPGVTYAEGFAGPGEYAGGEEGSPMIALRQVVDRPDLVKLGKPTRFVFVEQQQDRFDHLRQQVRSLSPRDGRPASIAISGTRGICQESLISELEKAGAFGEPIFANLDAWGADVPHEVVKRIAANPASEVLVTFVSDFFRRFATLDEIDKGDLQFGNRTWRKVADLPSEAKKPFLVDQYRSVLHSAGLPMTLTFELVDEGGHGVFLVYGTRDETGLARMKDAMWKVDPLYGLRFRDPRDVNQLAFNIDQPDLAPLSEDLRRELNDGERHRVKDLRRYTLLKTVYRPPHAMTVLRELRDNGDLETDGGRLREESLVWLS